jgi:hypothetical protein
MPLCLMRGYIIYRTMLSSSNERHDLRYLKKELKRKDGLAYTNFWSQIENIVQHVMTKYIAIRDEGLPTAFIQTDLEESRADTPESCTAQSLSCAPKILGFDFIMDAYRNPWLLEVNRFPGLEPRSSIDAAVKQTVSARQGGNWRYPAVKLQIILIDKSLHKVKDDLMLLCLIRTR